MAALELRDVIRRRIPVQICMHLLLLAFLHQIESMQADKAGHLG
jgi:hypothetical protein